MKKIASYVSLSEASELLGNHPSTVRRYLDRGCLRGRRFPDRWRISVTDVAEVLQDRRRLQADCSELDRGQDLYGPRCIDQLELELELADSTPDASTPNSEPVSPHGIN